MKNPIIFFLYNKMLILFSTISSLEYPSTVTRTISLDFQKQTRIVNQKKK